MCSVLPDEIVSNGLGCRSAAKESDVPDELGRQRQRRLQEIPPLHSQVVHLPSSKLPEENQQTEAYFKAFFVRKYRPGEATFRDVILRDYACGTL